MTPVATSGPALLTVMVKITESALFGVELLTVIVNDNSAVPTTCNMGAACTGGKSGTTMPPHNAAIMTSQSRLRQNFCETFIGSRRHRNG